MTRVVLLTGGNLGNVAANLARAEKLIGEKVGNIIEKSSVIQSPAWGFDSPELFGNQVLVVETVLEPRQVLAETQKIERVLGRGEKSNEGGYASRTIDIDILYYGDRVIDESDLHVPHLLIAQREFVLRPLAGVMPTWRDPRTGKTIEEMLDCLKK